MALFYGENEASPNTSLGYIALRELRVHLVFLVQTFLDI